MAVLAALAIVPSAFGAPQGVGSAATTPNRAAATSSFDDGQKAGDESQNEPLDVSVVEAIHRVAQLLVWPSSVMGEDSEPFSICSVGEDELGGALEALTGVLVAGRPVVVRNFESSRQVEFCHVLYVSGSEAIRQSQLIKVLLSSPILTASENPSFLEDGGMIQLEREPHGVRYEVNQAAVLGSGIAFVREADGTAQDLAAIQNIAGFVEGAPATKMPIDDRAVPEIALELAPVPLSPPDAESDSVSSVPEYAIGAGDLLSLDVFGHPELSRKVRVETSGSVRLPLLGKLDLAGLTLDQAEQALIDRLFERQILNDPQLSLSVEEYQSQKVTVQGAVEKPGAYQLIGRNTLLDVLGEAGGLTGSNRRAGQRIYIFRLGDDTEGEKLEIDLDRLMTQGDMSLNVLIEPGDIVLVPHEESSRVFVSGAVEKPGPVAFATSEPITILQALSFAGGATVRARLGKVAVLRKHPDGREERLFFDVKKIRKGERPDVLLQNNDTVIVSEWSL